MSDRKPLMAGNWKMHHTHLEAIQVVQKLSYRLDDKDYKDVDVAVFPAFTALRSVQTTLDSDDIPIALGAQNCHWEPQGAFTGEVSAPMLAKLHVPVRDRRALGAPRAVRRDRRDGRQEGPRRARQRDGPGRCASGRPSTSARRATTDDKVAGQVRAALAGLADDDLAAASSPTSRSGRSAPAATPRPDDANATIAHDSEQSRRRRRRRGSERRCGCSTAAA